MKRQILRDDQWECVKDLLSWKDSDCGVTAKDNHKFLEAVLWIARTGSPWRDLPDEFGHWHQVYNRFNRWCHKKVWSAIFSELSKDMDLEYLMMDGSIVKVHQYGAPKKQAKIRGSGSLKSWANNKNSRCCRWAW